MIIVNLLSNYLLFHLLLLFGNSFPTSDPHPPYYLVLVITEWFSASGNAEFGKIVQRGWQQTDLFQWQAFWQNQVGGTGVTNDANCGSCSIQVLQCQCAACWVIKQTLLH